MNIYAIRDRLLDYFLTPFAGPTDKEVMASVSNAINIGTNKDAIAQAPHHFEIWKVGEVTEQGRIEPRWELVCTCDSLVRADVRTPREPGGRQGEAIARGRHGTAGVDREDPYPNAGPPAISPPGAAQQATGPR